MTELQTVKLHKMLADLGHGSRREIERWIEAGRIKVNDQPAHVGQRVSVDDVVLLDERRVGGNVAEEPSRVLLMNKATGVITTRRDPEGRQTVFNDLPRIRGGRWISIGRLDYQTSGVLLLTNDGRLANRMAHPSTGLDREYAVRVFGELDPKDLQTLKTGVDIEGETLSFSDIRYFDGSGRNHWYHVVLMEGRNREVRRLFEAVGVTVSRLKRVRYGPVILPSWLRRGKFTELDDDDLSTLYTLLKLKWASAKPSGRDQRKPKKTGSVLMPYPTLDHLTPG
ncbi:MAG: pseudouridine synthase [Proteobacteria bacterium]|nr:pseudouridine synthase [Pseudomonadota bacterium]